MEFVEGEDLAQRLQRGPIPIDDAIAIAKQVAMGLEAAHERGIVHRDLKPANIKVRRDGMVKVLDFGLAKALDPPGGPDVNRMNSPTITSPPTRVGVILGTAVYMSPEQARGGDVDVRTDIWAFGAVLFELISGRQAFDGTTTTDVLAAIVRGEPDWHALPVNTPAPLVSLLHRCLRKDKTRRLHSIADARIELDEISLDHADRSADARSTPHSTRGQRTWQIVPWTIAALAVAAAAFFASRAMRTAGAIEPMLHVAIAGPPEAEFFVRWGETMALSRDGQTVGFVAYEGASRRIYLRPLREFKATAVNGTDHALTMFFSPDGQRVGFITPERILRTVSLADETVSVLTNNTDYRGVTWLDDGSIIVSKREGLFQIPGTGGQLRQITTTQPGELHLSPAGINGSRAVLFANLSAVPGSRRLEAVSLADGRRHVVMEQAAGPVVLPDRDLLFTRDDGVYAARFDNGPTITGTPIKIAEEVVVRGDGSALIDVAQNGSMLYAPKETLLSELQWVPRSGSESSVSERRMAYGNPRLSPDGRRMAFEDLTGAVWVNDLERAALIKVSVGASFQNSFPAWASNTRLVYKTAYDLRTVDMNALGPGTVIPGSGSQDFPCDVSPDGKLAFVRNDTKQSGDLFITSMDTADAEALVSTPGYDGGLSFSPDGRWFVYSSNESGRPEIYVRRLRGAGKWQVSANGGTQPVWARNGEIFYRSGQKMFAVRVRLEDQPILSPPELVFDRPYAYGSNVSIANYSVSADGARLVMVKTLTDSVRLHLVTNWTRQLQRRLGRTD
jgi:Tol biopolymer transport system component